jgi:membrane protein YqaA with SNARE-associated domain
MSNAPDIEQPLTPGQRLRQMLPLLAAILITIIVGGLGVYYRAELMSLGRYGLIGIFLINLINNATVILPAPFGIALTCLFAGVAHPLLVAVAGGLGSAVGEFTAYMAGSGGNAVIPHGRIYRLMRYYIRKAGVVFIFLLAAIPNPLFDVGGLIAGALKMPPLVFLAATFAGKTVRYVLIVYGCLGGLPLLGHLLRP